MFCGCGCGKESGEYKHTIPHKHMVKGSPKRFLPGHNKDSLLKAEVCVRGHARTPDNVYPSGSCIACNRYKKLLRYGITEEDKSKQLAEQDNKCAICREPFTLSLKPETDHDHATDKVRGQLCHYCNVMLGEAKDNVQTLLNAVEYLRRNSE